MSRVRYHVSSVNAHIWTDRSDAYPVYSQDGLCGLCWNHVSNITDELSQSNRFSNNPCTHTMLQASKFVNATANRTIFWWNGDSYIRPFSVTASVYPLNWASYLTVPGTDWVSLVVDLAESVRGFIKSKSLLAATFGELHKTVEMVRNPFQLLRRQSHRVGHLTLRQAAERGSDVWLEYNYGWRALKYDIENLSTALGKYHAYAKPWSTHEHFSRFSSNANSTSSTPAPTTSDSAWNAIATSLAYGYHSGSGNGAVIRVKFLDRTNHYRVSCWALDAIVGQANRIEQLIRTLGLDIPGLARTWWELVPCSFVVDWFFNLQGIMNLPLYTSALNTLNEVSVRDLCYTQKGMASYVAQCLPHHGTFDGYQMWEYFGVSSGFCPAEPTMLVGSPGHISLFQRDVGIPPATVGVLTGRALSLSQITSSISLITQRAKRYI